MLSELNFTLKPTLASQKTDAFLTTICLQNVSHCSKLKKLWVAVGQLAGRGRIGTSSFFIWFFMVMNILAWQQPFFNHTVILLGRHAKMFVHLSQSEKDIMLQRYITDQSYNNTWASLQCDPVKSLPCFHLGTFLLTSLISLPSKPP